MGVFINLFQVKQYFTTLVLSVLDRNKLQILK